MIVYRHLLALRFLSVVALSTIIVLFSDLVLRSPFLWSLAHLTQPRRTSCKLQLIQQTPSFQCMVVTSNFNVRSLSIPLNWLA